MTYGVYPAPAGAAGPPGPPGPPGTGLYMAPKYVVGNLPNGDTIASYNADGFFYYQDPGDGSGIEAALAAAALSPGDVHIRPGTYDFNAGAVVTPLTIPAGIVVSGAGDSTQIIARTAGDQGVFVLQSSGGAPNDSCIRDMRIVALDAGNAGIGSFALVSIRGSGVKVQNVNFEFVANALSTLRCAIFVSVNFASPVPLVSIENVSAVCNTSLLAVSSPTIGLLLEEGQVHLANVQTVGFDYGYHVAYNGGGNAAVLFGDTVYAVQFAQYGFYATSALNPSNVAAVRIHNGITFAAFAAPPLGAGTNAGFQIEAGYAVTIASCVLLGAYYGANVAPAAGTTTNVQIDDSTIASTTVCVRFGEGTTDSAVTGCDLGDDYGGVPVTSNFGVFVDALGLVGAAGITIDGNAIHVTDYDATLINSCGVLLLGARSAFVSDNEIKRDGGGGAYAAIHCEACTDTSITNNSIEPNGANGGLFIDSDSDRLAVTGNQLVCPDPATLYGFDIRGTRVTITGNTIDHTQSTSLSPTLEVRGDGCTITGNTIKPSPTGTAPAIGVRSIRNTIGNNVCASDNPAPIAAIILYATAQTNTCIGNVCLTAPPVTDLGALNEVAHNI